MSSSLFSFICHHCGLDRVIITVYRVAALAAGRYDFLTKPVSLEWLSIKIIEWGFIKASQLFTDSQADFVEPEPVSAGQAIQAPEHTLRAGCTCPKRQLHTFARVQVIQLDSGGGERIPGIESR